MLVKFGVDVSKLNRAIRKTLNTVLKIYTHMGLPEPTVTSTYEGNHSPGSFHYSNDAYDLRLPTHVIQQLNDLVANLQEALPDCDVILEGNHIHVEYDPK